jgi:hypothetical protein
MPKEEVDNTRVLWSDVLSDDEHMGCVALVKCQIEATIKETMLETTFNDMVDKDDMEVPYFLPVFEKEGFLNTIEKVVDP